MYYFGPSKDKQNGLAEAADPAESSALMAPQLASIRSNPNGSLASNSNPATNAAAATGLASLSRDTYLYRDITSRGSNMVQISNNGVGQIINPPHLEMSVYTAAPMHGQATMAPSNQGPAMTLPSCGIMPFQAPLPHMNCGQFPAYPVQSYQAPLPVPFTPMAGQFALSATSVRSMRTVFCTGTSSSEPSRTFHFASDSISTKPVLLPTSQSIRSNGTSTSIRHGSSAPVPSPNACQICTICYNCTSISTCSKCINFYLRIYAASVQSKWGSNSSSSSSCCILRAAESQSYTELKEASS